MSQILEFCCHLDIRGTSARVGMGGPAMKVLFETKTQDGKRVTVYGDDNSDATRMEVY